MINKYGKIALAASVLALTSASAYATAELRLHDGVNPDVIVIDNNIASGDLSPVAGSILTAGSIGVFTFTLDTALTKPLDGTAQSPVLSLTFNETSSGPGTLVVSFSDTDFGPSSGKFVTSASGSSTVVFTGTGKGFVDTGNTIFGTGTQVGQVGPITGLSFSGTQTSPSTSLGAGYSAMIQVIAAHSGAGTSTGTAVLNLVSAVPDGGNTVMLLGSSMALVGFVANRRKQTA